MAKKHDLDGLVATQMMFKSGTGPYTVCTPTPCRRKCTQNLRSVLSKVANSSFDSNISHFRAVYSSIHPVCGGLRDQSVRAESKVGAGPGEPRLEARRC